MRGRRPYCTAAARCLPHLLLANRGICSTHICLRYMRPVQRIELICVLFLNPTNANQSNFIISRSYGDKEVQRDKKLVSYDIVDKGSKPYVQARPKIELMVSNFFPSIVDGCCERDG